jgi:hypothetical protein
MRGAFGARRLMSLCLAGGLALAGCAPEPLLDGSVETPPVALVPTARAGIVDQRARFREIFCALSEDHGVDLPDHRPCDQVLHRLAGEAPASGAAVNLGQARIGLRLVVVPGLAGQCFGELALPLRLAARHVEQLGYEVSRIDVDGLSSSARNAAEIRAAILAMEEVAERPIVLLGYSKGATDLLEALADATVAARVAAIVSLSGAINGSPLADKASGTLLDVLADLPGTTCEPGDRGALNSMRRATRMAWLAGQPRSPIRSYSLVSYAARDQISAVLRSSYDDLSLIDPRNDSQMLFYDQIVPRSTLLGYLNADHWAVAMPLARDAVLMDLLVDHNAFPREILLEAILKQVEEDLIAADGTEGRTAARPVTDAGVNRRERTDPNSVARRL